MRRHSRSPPRRRPSRSPDRRGDERLPPIAMSRASVQERGRDQSHPRTCHECGQPGHLIRDCPERSTDRRRDTDEKEEDAAPVQEPDFKPSGLLAASSNAKHGIPLKWAEPQDARPPQVHWRLYVFKGEDVLDTLHIHRQSCFLIGRDRRVADIGVDHPSCSSQHAVIQFKLKRAVDHIGNTTATVRPYVCDLESTNGTYVNGKQLEGARLVELYEKDVIRFGHSTREYVLLRDDSV